MISAVQTPRAPLRKTHADSDLMAYLHIRLRTRIQRRFSRAAYMRLLEMDLPQMTHFMSEAGYGEQARALGLTRKGSALIRMMVEGILQSEMAALRKICACSTLARAWLGLYAWKYDLLQLRFVLRARTAGMHPQSPPVMLVWLGNLPREVYNRLLSAERIDPEGEELKPFRPSPFWSTLQDFFGGKGLDPEVLEFSLLLNFYRDTLVPMAHGLPEGDPGRSLLLAEIHLVNFSTLLAGRIAGLTPTELQPRLITEGIWAREERMREILAMAEWPPLLQALGENDRSGFFATMLKEGELPTTERGFERLARQAFLRSAKKTLSSSTFSPASLVAYIILLEVEARNLAALASGKEAGVSREEQEEYLVVD